MCVMAERSIDPVADILAVAIVLHGKKDYVKNTTHNIQRHVTGYLQLLFSVRVWPIKNKNCSLLPK